MSVHRRETTSFTRQELLNGDAAAVVDMLFGSGTESVLPCEKCGGTARDDDNDRISLVRGAREEPVNDFDRRVAADGKRVVRICATCWPTWGMHGFIWPNMEIPKIRRCPRCATNFIPTNEAPGEYPGAMSRVEGTDRSVEICSACGQDEAIGHGVVPIEEWPVSWMPVSYDDKVRDAIREGRLTLIDEATGEPAPIDPDAPISIVVEDDDVTLDSEVKLTFGVEEGRLRMQKNDPDFNFKDES